MVQRRAISTREEVIRLLHEQGPASVAGLAERIGVSEGAIRRHMDIMLAEGLVESRLERQGRGRPGLVYSLSVEGEERTAAANYARLLERLYPALESLPLTEVSGESGETTIEAPLRVSGVERLAKGAGNGPIAAFVDALRRDANIPVAVLDYNEHALTAGRDAEAAAYLEIEIGEQVLWGVGISESTTQASLRAVVSGVNRVIRSRA